MGCKASRNLGSDVPNPSRGHSLTAGGNYSAAAWVVGGERCPEALRASVSPLGAVVGGGSSKGIYPTVGSAHRGVTAPPGKRGRVDGDTSGL